VQLQAVCEKTAEGWQVEVAALDNLKISSKRLDKVEAHIRELAKNHPMAGDCELVIEIIAKMPGIICDVEAAQEKMRLAAKLQEEASIEIRSVVGRMRDEGLTLRDIAVLLGVTPQRIAQLIPCQTDA
jgi:metal-dependent amidase/aminoacylase/carboxypeptidase family protein